MISCYIQSGQKILKDFGPGIQYIYPTFYLHAIHKLNQLTINAFILSLLKVLNRIELKVVMLTSPGAVDHHNPFNLHKFILCPKKMR